MKRRGARIENQMEHQRINYVRIYEHIYIYISTYIYIYTYIVAYISRDGYISLYGRTGHRASSRMCMQVSPQARHKSNCTPQLAFCTSSPLLSILVLMGSAHPP